jgi:hypothetical protein
MKPFGRKLFWGMVKPLLAVLFEEKAPMRSVLNEGRAAVG